MSAFVVARSAVQLVAGLGVSRVVAQVIQNNTTIVTVADKVLVNTGSIVLGLIVVDHASDRVNYAFDKFADWNEKRKEEFEAEEKKNKNGKNGNKNSS